MKSGVAILTLSVALLGFCSLANSKQHQQQQLEKYNWWQHEVFYQIYPRSFKDSNGDGIGDLKGITGQLEYFVETGITAVWMSPIFDSPMEDFGYDISDYYNIWPTFGTLADFDELVAKATSLGIKIILDFVPNHTSDKHEWFVKSVNRESGYEDFYIWRDALVDANGERRPPNNWRSVFSGSAWEWNETRGQYYLRQFTKGQPDLDFRNPNVLKAMEQVIVFWLNRGIAGFRIDSMNYIFEDAQLRDEPLSGTTNDTNAYTYLNHIYTKNQYEVYGLLQSWRKVLDNFTAENDGPMRIMMTEGYADLSILMDYYEDSEGRLGAEFPFNFDFITSLNGNSQAADFVYFIERWLIYMPWGHAANWVMSNHDNPRVSTRFGKDSVDAMNMLLLTLPGIGCTYYGDEMGMLDYVDISYADTQDPPACDAGEEGFRAVSRDPERTPMQWNNSTYAGFSSAKPWLPVNPNYVDLNVEAQKAASRSHYKNFQTLLQLRKFPVLQDGEFISQALSRRVFAFKRVLKGKRTIVTIINVSDSKETVDLSGFVYTPNRLTVLVAGVTSQYKAGDVLKPTNITLAPKEGLVGRLLIWQ